MDILSWSLFMMKKGHEVTDDPLYVNSQCFIRALRKSLVVNEEMLFVDNAAYLSVIILAQLL